MAMILPIGVILFMKTNRMHLTKKQECGCGPECSSLYHKDLFYPLYIGLYFSILRILFVPHRKHVSTTKTSRSMLLSGAVARHCQNLFLFILARTLKYSEEMCPQCRSVRHRSHMTWPGLEPGLPVWEPGDWSPELSHGRIVRTLGNTHLHTL
jgi:hypothetical protein